MIQRLHRPDIGLLALRVAIGAIFFLHGWTKLVGQREMFVREILNMVGWTMPDIAIWAVTALELIGGLALILGILARWAALALTLEMVLVVLMFHIHQGFFIVAVPNVPLAYGLEFHLALIGGLICTTLAGPGRWSLSRRFNGAT